MDLRESVIQVRHVETCDQGGSRRDKEVERNLSEKMDGWSMKVGMGAAVLVN